MLDNIKEQLKNKVEEIVRELNLELIELKLSVYGTKYTLRCFVDYPKGGITVGECAETNRMIFNFLEESKLLGDDYVVEVNSPGLDRALKGYNDFLRVLGRNLNLWLASPLEGRDYLEGILIDLSLEFLFLKCKDRVYRIEFNNIKLGKEKVEI
jgi:ribosome maturation factor RimP